MVDNTMGNNEVQDKKSTVQPERVDTPNVPPPRHIPGIPRQQPPLRPQAPQAPPPATMSEIERYVTTQRMVRELFRTILEDEMNVVSIYEKQIENAGEGIKQGIISAAKAFMFARAYSRTAELLEEMKLKMGL